MESGLRKTWAPWWNQKRKGMNKEKTWQIIIEIECTSRFRYGIYMESPEFNKERSWYNKFLNPDKKINNKNYKLLDVALKTKQQRNWYLQRTQQIYIFGDTKTKLKIHRLWEKRRKKMTHFESNVFPAFFSHFPFITKLKTNKTFIIHIF